MEAKGSGVQGQSWLDSKFVASLGYLKKKKSPHKRTQRVTLSKSTTQWPKFFPLGYLLRVLLFVSTTSWGQSFQSQSTFKPHGNHNHPAWPGSFCFFSFVSLTHTELQNISALSSEPLFLMLLSRSHSQSSSLFFCRISDPRQPSLWLPHPISPLGTYDVPFPCNPRALNRIVLGSCQSRKWKWFFTFKSEAVGYMGGEGIEEKGRMEETWSK